MDIAIQKNTKLAILELAESFIHEKGYNAFSYKDISAALGIRNASVHYHFQTKEDLGEAVVLNALDKLLKLREKVFTKNLEIIEELEFFFSIYVHYLEKKQKIGLTGALAANYFSIPEKMQKAGQQLIQAELAWLQSILEKGLQARKFYFIGEVYDKTLQMLVSLEGALQIARFTDKEDFYRILTQIRKEIIHNP